VSHLLQVSCLCLTFYNLRDCFPCALQCALVEIGVAAGTCFDVSSCNKTQRRYCETAERLPVELGVTVGLLLNYWWWCLW